MASLLGVVDVRSCKCSDRRRNGHNSYLHVSLFRTVAVLFLLCSSFDVGIHVDFIFFIFLFLTVSRFISALASKPELWLVFGAVTVWNGALTSAYAMWAQTRGQASVAPSEVRFVPHFIDVAVVASPTTL